MEEVYERAMELILSAGGAKSKAMMAIQAAREFRFEDAEKLLAEAQDEFAGAHHAQTELLQGEVKGEKTEVNLIVVHSQDHLTMAMMACDNAQEFLNLYHMIYELKQK